MKKSIWSLVWNNVIEWTFIFMAICVIYKLILKEESWLSFSIIYSISYTLGLFVKPLLIEGKITKTYNIAIIIGLVLICFIVSAFVTGVLLNVAAWFSFVCWKITVPFTIALFIGKSGPLQKDEEKQEQNEDSEEKDKEVKVRVLD